VAVALFALVATLSSAAGRYIGDNRFELYWAPFELLERHLGVWDATRGLGRARWDFWPATAAVIAVLRGIGLGPDLAERVWHAALLTTAGIGAAAALRLFRPRVGIEHWVAAFLYAFGPFAAVYLLPTNLFVGHAFAPWFLFAFVKGVRGDRPLRWAALFALLWFVPGNMNYPALLFAALPLVPAALYLTLVERSVSWARVARWIGAAAVLTLLVSAAALVTVRQSSAINDENLALTETVREINRTSSWSESWRGLGFWGAYWGDSRGAIIPQFARFFWWPLVLATFLVPLASVATLWRARWRPRILFGGVLVLGLVLMVGAFPLDDTTPYGRFLLWAFDSFPGVLAVRSGHKAGVLVALGAATLAAVAFAAVVGRARARAGGWRHPLPIVAAGATAAVVLAVSFPFWTGRLYSPNDGVDELPTYWEQAADFLDARPGSGRVLVLPSTALGAYTWGMAGDDIIEGSLERPSISRGLLTKWSGTDEVANIVAGLDDYVNGQEYEPGAIGPIARRLGIEYVLVRNDLDWPASKRPRPSALDALRDDPDLELVRSFGAPGENVSQPDPASTEEAGLPPVEIYRVRDFEGVARAATRPPLLVSGDGDAWPGLAAVDLLGTAGPVRYTGAASTPELEDALEAGSPVVISDTNRRRAHEIPIFDSIARSSYTLAAGQELHREVQVLFDEPSAESVAHFPDAEMIEASSYGRPPLPQTYYRPSNAFDRDPRTSWRVSPAFVDEDEQWVRVDFGEPQDVTDVHLVAAQTKASDLSPDPMHVTRATVVLSDGTEQSVELVDGEGHAEFEGLPTESVEVRIDEVDGTDPRPFGLSEITIDELDLREAIQLPDDLLGRADGSPRLRTLLEAAPMTYQFGRLERLDDHAVEPALHRRFRTLGDREYSVRGQVDGAPLAEPATCRDIGLTIDGTSVAVRGVEATSFVGCAPVELDQGSHTLTSERDPSIRRVWLQAGEQPNADPDDASATLVERGRTDFEVEATTDAPGVIISGQSSDDGWSATIDGDDAGTQTSLDGQAAWSVEAGEHRLQARQSPQVVYQVALVVTGLGLLLCCFLLVRGRFR
jgi:arabinofuranan 3-O-arabinosyltransferase